MPLRLFLGHCRPLQFALVFHHYVGFCWSSAAGSPSRFVVELFLGRDLKVDQETPMAVG